MSRDPADAACLSTAAAALLGTEHTNSVLVLANLHWV
jgi:hypothetical protein